MEKNLVIATYPNSEGLQNQRSGILNRFRHKNKWLLNH